MSDLHSLPDGGDELLARLKARFETTSDPRIEPGVVRLPEGVVQTGRYIVFERQEEANPTGYIIVYFDVTEATTTRTKDIVVRAAVSINL